MSSENRARNSSLTEDKVAEIGNLLTTDLKIKDIASKFGVSISTISLINQGTRWGKHLTKRGHEFPIRKFNHLKKGEMRNTRNLTKKQVDLAVKMFYCGVTSGNVAKALDVPLAWVVTLRKGESWKQYVEDKGYEYPLPKNNKTKYRNVIEITKENVNYLLVNTLTLRKRDIKKYVTSVFDYVLSSNKKHKVIVYVDENYKEFDFSRSSIKSNTKYVKKDFDVAKQLIDFVK